MKDNPRVEVTSRADLREWLAENHAQDRSIWLVTYKKAAGDRYLPYPAIVEEALSFGWIDSLPRKLDDRRTMVLLSPRRSGSSWSAANRERVARLEAQGLMTAAGRAKITEAKADGSWDRLLEAERGTPPPDLAAALESAEAEDSWKAFTAPTRRRLLEFLGAAKRDTTRAARIAKIVAGAVDGTDPLTWRRARSP